MDSDLTDAKAAFAAEAAPMPQTCGNLPEFDGDEAAPMRGIAYGIVLSSPFWLAILLFGWLLR